jgi:hypothetical protein
MRWGTARADELGLESWIDATGLGRPLYAKHGYVVVSTSTLKPQQPEGLSGSDAKEWKKMEEEILPAQTITMWRPKGGRYVEGETVKPWEVGQ